MRRPILLAILATAAALPGAAAQQSANPNPQSPTPIPHKWCTGDPVAAKGPTILPGYGAGGFPIRTAIPAAQLFFDNGMQLASAFAHTAAVAAMKEAARLDPACAACLWGEAWASGPTINYPIGEADAARLATLVARARTLLPADAPEKERALIEALTLRYPIPPRARSGATAGRGASDAGTTRRVVEGSLEGPYSATPANLAFAQAMDALARRWPDDDAIAVLAADAWLISAFDSWTSGKLPRAIALLETVLKRRPDYTPAIHFYIHATEVSGDPARAEPYADRLQALAPAATHLIHMPSHTYLRIGRYRDAVAANVRAVEIGQANARRLGIADTQGAWGQDYHAHNVRFGVGAALISGEGKAALALGEPLLARLAAGNHPTGAWAQMTAGTAYFALGRFADPAAMRAAPGPPRQYGYAVGYWHYARGEAAARLGDAKAVRAEAAAIRIPRPDRNDDGAQPATQTLQIARHVLEGRAFMLEAKPAAALTAFRRAAKLQEKDGYAGMFDPPAFWYPVRRDVAAALLALGRGKEAMAEVDAALAMFPKDPESERIRGRALARSRRGTAQSFIEAKPTCATSGDVCGKA